MKIKEFTIGKKILTNTGNFSNIEVSHSMTFEVGEDEEVDWDRAYDILNQQLQLESDGVDYSWIKKGETKDDWKITIYLPKRKVMKDESDS